MDKFKKIGLIGRLNSSAATSTLSSLVEMLQLRGAEVVLDLESEAVLPEHTLQTAPRKLLGEVSDLVIVVGGDGCLLGAARSLASSGVPVVGVNRGNLGFLTDIRPQELDAQLDQLLRGHYRKEERFLLNAEVKRDRQPVAHGSALNDVVLRAAASVHILEFELYVEGEFVYSQRSDGLIVSTPTGSTAYALSGGGPIMHPSLDAIVLVPMNPHTLSSRPIVVSGNSEIKIVMTSNQAPVLSCDGLEGVPLKQGDSIYIRKKHQKLTLLHPLDHDFYETCRSKLGWGSQL